MSRYSLNTYPTKSKIANDTASNATIDTAVLDLRGTSVGVHLAELQLSLRAGTLREGGVADDVAQSLAVQFSQISQTNS